MRSVMRRSEGNEASAGAPAGTVGAANASLAATEPEGVGAVPVPLVAGAAAIAGGVLGIFFGPTLAKQVEKVSPRVAAAMRQGLMGADDGLGSPDPTLRGVWPPPKGPPPGRARWGNVGATSYEETTLPQVASAIAAAVLQSQPDSDPLVKDLKVSRAGVENDLVGAFMDLARQRGVYVTAPGQAVPSSGASIGDAAAKNALRAMGWRPEAIDLIADAASVMRVRFYSMPMTKGGGVSGGLGAAAGPGVASYDVVVRQATEAMVRGGQDKGVLPLDLGTAMLADLPKLFAAFAAKGVYVTAPGAAVPAGYAEVADPDPGTDYRGVVLLAQLGRVRFYKGTPAPAAALAPPAGGTLLLPPAGSSAPATPTPCPRGCVVSGATDDVGAPPPAGPGDYGHLDGEEGEGDLAGDGTPEGTSVGATRSARTARRVRAHQPAHHEIAAPGAGGLVGDGTPEGTSAHAGAPRAGRAAHAAHAHGVHGLDEGTLAGAVAPEDDGLGWAREVGPKGHRYRVAIEKVTPKAEVPIENLEKLKGALDAITKALPPSTPGAAGGKPASVAGWPGADALDGDGSDDAGCAAGDDLEGDGTEGVGDDVFRGIVKTAKGVGDVWVPGAGTAIAEGTTAIKRAVDVETGHVDPRDPATQVARDRAARAAQAKKDQAAAAPTAAVAGHEETMMTDHANGGGGGGDDVGASPVKGIPGTPIPNGKSYTARGKHVKAINEPVVAKWIWAHYGAPLQRAKAQVVRLQRQGSTLIGQLNECRAALQAANLTAPDDLMPDLSVSDLDLSDVIGDDDDGGFSADDYLSGAHDQATAAEVAGIVGGADDLGAKPEAWRKAARHRGQAAAAARQEARREYVKLRHAQHEESHLIGEVNRLKAELAQAKREHGNHALVHALERALAVAVAALDADNRAMAQGMISPTGPRMGFPGGYSDPRAGLAGAPPASGGGVGGVNGPAAVPPYQPGAAPSAPTAEPGNLGCGPCTGALSMGPAVGPAPWYPGVGGGYGNPYMN